MISYKRLFILVILFFVVMSNNITIAADTPAEVNVGINENQVSISGTLNEANTDITIIAYRSSDNSRIYIDQGKTDDSGNFSFSFALPNGTYYAVINADGIQYRTEEIVAYKDSEEPQPEQINVTVDENKITISGKINENNGDVTLVVYREGDNSKAYLDQGKTDSSGNFSFSFALPNGTYFAVINADGTQYRTEEIVSYKAGEEPQPVDINVVVDENNVNVTGKINENNRDVTLIVYREGDNSKTYVDQGRTDGSGNFSFSFALPNGTYYAVISTKDRQYITDAFTVEYTKQIISAEISPKNESFDKNTSKQTDITTYIIWNDAEHVVDVKNLTSIGANNYILDNYKLTIKKEYLATQQKGDLVLSIEFDKGLPAVFTINIVDTTGGGGGSGGGGTTPDPTPELQPPIVLPTDIDGHWSEEYIIGLIGRGIVSNYPDNTFRPEQNITRAEFVTLIVKTIGFESKELNVFDDTISHWAIDYISAAIENNIVLGYGNNLFGPDDLITREQMAIIISKAMKLNVELSEMSFEDANQISDWALNYVASAAREKIIKGYPDNTFKPKNYLTRAEAATILYNITQ